MATRSIELYNKTWECPDCGRNATLNLKKCRGCGRLQPVYGILPDAVVVKDARPAPVGEKKAPKKKSGNSLISNDDDKLFVSTLKMKDGK